VRKKKVVAEGMTVADVDNIIKQSNAQLQEICRNYYKLKDPEMQKELDAISNQFRQIFKIIKEDPKDIKNARRYMNTTFLSLSTIVNQSVQLFQVPNLSDEAKASLKNAKEGMRMIREATDKQINKFYENNILDLDVELAVLKKSLSARGLLEEAAPASEDDERKEKL
jgi:5-bromo-4-chloroindolyl phosphate hydrolysis protein